ncbi:MAG: DUF2490 domain-containing protein [Prevotellaceae bacterium]|nr:DUF2490 domain-containing protein [Prevotellaceae bacterium]
MRRFVLIALACSLSSLSWAGDDDDFGMWVDLGAQKVLPRNFTVGAEAELRTRDTSKKVDRLSIGVDAGYKLNKYLKFGVAYSFIDSYKDGKRSKEEYEYGTDDLISYRHTSSYWRPRHRLSIDVTPTVKVLRMLRISLRERYQYTHQKEVSIPRADYEINPETGVYERDDEVKLSDKVKSAKDTHLLRSRLKLELDKKACSWSPFVSVEAMNYFRQMELCKVRATAGTEYEINKRNSVGLAYVFTYDKQDKERFHAISLSYNIKF